MARTWIGALSLLLGCLAAFGLVLESDATAAPGRVAFKKKGKGKGKGRKGKNRNGGHHDGRPYTNRGSGH